MFRSNANKDLIREQIDARIVEEFAQDVKRERKKLLTYFGLPGPELRDICAWRDYVEFCVAVENARDPLITHLIRDRAYQIGFHSRVQILRGDVDYVLTSWRDDEGFSPRVDCVDLVNLDYCGGIMYKDFAGRSRRIKAIKELIQRQGEHQRDFLLLLTVNARMKDRGELNDTIRSIGERLTSDYKSINCQDTIAWYLRQPFDQRLHVYVPYVLDKIAAPNSFMLDPLASISYSGTGNVRMIHFVFKFAYQKGCAGTAIGKSYVDILNSDLCEVKNGKINPCEVNRPRIIT